MRVGPAQSDLRDHPAHVRHLDWSLFEDPPDFLDQTVNHMFVADVVGHILNNSLADQCQLALLPLGLTGHTEQQAQVDGQHLGQVVMGLFG